ncbi:MAG: hypothetical protein ACD_54C01174G0001 [uncultured bacterium]|nr:MAG: hypothetical protein ACD_54C01174G0001 [uncultured bacterium]
MRSLLFQRRENGLFIGSGGRQLVHHLLRNNATLHQIVEADRVAITVQPAQLTLVRVDVFHPQLGGVRVRRISRNRLHIDARQSARSRDDHFGLRVACQRVTPCQRVVVPGRDDRGCALRDAAGLAADRHEIACLVQPGKELQPLGGRLGPRFAAHRHACRHHRHQPLVARARIARQRKRPSIFRLHQIGPVGRQGRHHVGVHDERHHAIIVAIPEAICILGTVRDAVPGRNLVGLDQPFFLGSRAERQTDIQHVRSLRAGVALVGAHRFQLVCRRPVRVQFVHGDLGILLLEALDHGTIAAPVMRQRDGGQRAFGLGCSGDFFQRLRLCGTGNQHRQQACAACKGIENGHV